MDEQLRQSPLAECHTALNARMVPFAGWNMPVQYAGIIPENQAVRQKLGVFDISHMGQIVVGSSEPGVAGKWLNGLLTNNLDRLKTGEGQYTFLLNPSGGVIDDLIIYRAAHSEYFLVVNASRTQQDFEWLTDHLPDSGIMLADRSASFAGMAVQGPETERAFAELMGDTSQLPDRFCIAILNAAESEVIVCRTGYTGEDGFELFCPADHGPSWWQRCLDAGAAPCGLGARDSLRLEKCYPLNGSDLSPEHTPLQAGMGFAVDLGKPEFTGREALIRQKSAGLTSRLVAIRQTGKSPPPRAGYKVFSEDREVGTLTSGGVSPNLRCGISLAYVGTEFAAIGTVLEVEIRAKRYPAEVVKKPFL